jgi:hypothetical protein
MKHLSQQMIASDVRRPHLRRYRKSLLRRLSSGNLSDDVRRVLERDLQNLGKPKTYDPNDPPPPGALRGGRSPLVDLGVDAEDATFESLSKFPHTRLYLYALQKDLEVRSGDTKAQVVDTILRHLTGEEP